MDYGQHPRLGIEPIRSGKVEAAEEFAVRMKKITEEARAALSQASDDMKRFYDAKHQEAPQYKLGDLVWLNTKDIRTTRPAKKLDNKWEGPFPIDKIISRNAYRLKLPHSFKIHPVFSVSKLQPCKPD